MQYRYVAPSSHFVRNGVSLDFRVASLLKIQFAYTTPSGSSPPRWGAKNVLPLNLMALLFTRQPTAACHVSTIIISCFYPARENFTQKGECHSHPISRLFIHSKGSSAASRNVRSALEIHIHTALTVLLLSVRTFPSSFPLDPHMICSIAMQP